MSNSQRYFFGIGVASYEQFDGLLQTIQSLINLNTYLHSYGIEINICISDNNSKNFPPDILEIIKNKTDIKLVLQPENRGFSGNLMYLLSNLDARYVLIIGCGETVDAKAIKELIEKLSETDSSDRVILGGTVGNQNTITRHQYNLELSPDNLAVNPSISLSVWNSSYIDRKLLEKEWRNDWPHIELVAAIHRDYPKGHYFYFDAQTVFLDQPQHGWHNSQDFLNLILRFDDLVSENSELNLGVNLSANYRAIGSWIYYYRKSSTRHVPFRSFFLVLLRARMNPVGFLYILAMGLVPKFLVQAISKTSNFLR